MTTLLQVFGCDACRSPFEADPAAIHPHEVLCPACQAGRAEMGEGDRPAAAQADGVLGRAFAWLAGATAGDRRGLHVAVGKDGREVVMDSLVHLGGGRLRNVAVNVRAADDARPAWRKQFGDGVPTIYLGPDATYERMVEAALAYLADKNVPGL